MNSGRAQEAPPSGGELVPGASQIGFFGSGASTNRRLRGPGGRSPRPSPGRRDVALLRVLARAVGLLATSLREALELPLVCLAGLRKRGKGSAVEVLLRRLPGFCERLGGAFPKIGQILSTRADLLSEEVCRSLGRLQDEVGSLPQSDLEKCLQDCGALENFREIARVPVASATIAQVHSALRIDDGRRVALKVMRPGVRARLARDCVLARAVGRVVARLPRLRSVPVQDALEEASELLLAQTDFRREASNLERLGAAFAGVEGVLVPALHPDRCSDAVLCMDFIPGMRKLSDPGLSEQEARTALTIGVRALYRMIFSEGFIHCDMHPGNVLLAPDGRVVILDAGFMAELDEGTRKAFAEFFLAIAFRDGRAAARIVRETATRLPATLNVEAFDQDIGELIARVGGLRAREFQVAAFVADLFAIQRKHRIYGTSKFTLTILSLLVYEGVAKARFPDLDFQRESIPFALAALAN